MKKLNYLLISILLGTLSFSSNIFALNNDSETKTTTTNGNTQVVSDAKADALITEGVKGQISKSSTLSPLSVDVKTQDGVVIFTGTVDSDSQASSLVESAQMVVGVKDVDTSKLQIKESKEPLNDMWITAKVKGLLIREDIFGTKDIASINLSVETKNGVVYLTGVIDNKDQINNAIKLIKGVKGVKKVDYNVKKLTPVAQ